MGYKSIFNLEIDATVKGKEELKEAGGLLQGLGNAAGGAMSGLSGKLTGAAAGTFLLEKGLEAVKWAWANIEAGAKETRVLQAFESWAGGAEAAEAKMKSLQGALGGFRDDGDIAKVSNTLRRMGLDAEQQAVVFRKARQEAVRTGEDELVIAESLGKAAALGQARGLKQYGIVLDNATAQAQYAAAIGKTVDQLSEEEKVTANRNAAVAGLAKATDASRNAASNIELLKGAWEGATGAAAQAAGASADAVAGIIAAVLTPEAVIERAENARRARAEAAKAAAVREDEEREARKRTLEEYYVKEVDGETQIVAKRIKSQDEYSKISAEIAQLSELQRTAVGGLSDAEKARLEELTKSQALYAQGHREVAAAVQAEIELQKTAKEAAKKAGEEAKKASEDFRRAYADAERLAGRKPLSAGEAGSLTGRTAVEMDKYQASLVQVTDQTGKVIDTLIDEARLRQVDLDVLKRYRDEFDQLEDARNVSLGNRAKEREVLDRSIRDREALSLLDEAATEAQKEHNDALQRMLDLAFPTKDNYDKVKDALDKLRAGTLSQAAAVKVLTAAYQAQMDAANGPSPDNAEAAAQAAQAAADAALREARAKKAGSRSRPDTISSQEAALDLAVAREKDAVRKASLQAELEFYKIDRDYKEKKIDRAKRDYLREKALVEMNSALVDKTIADNDRLAASNGQASDRMKRATFVDSGISKTPGIQKSNVIDFNRLAESNKRGTDTFRGSEDAEKQAWQEKMTAAQAYFDTISSGMQRAASLGGVWGQTLGQAFGGAEGALNAFSRATTLTDKAQAQAVASGIVSSGKMASAFTSNKKWQAYIEGAFEAAASIASYAMGDPVGGTLHALSSSMFFALAGKGSSSKASANASSGRNYASAAQSTTKQEKPATNITVNLQGFAIGDERTVGATVATMVNAAVGRVQLDPRLVGTVALGV